MTRKRLVHRVTTGIPNDIAVAAVGDMALRGWARSLDLFARSGEGRVFIATAKSPDEPRSIWIDPTYPHYRRVWMSAAQAGLVDRLEVWGDGVDVDHLYPRSWAIEAGLRFVRLQPTWAEVNRSAGGGREKHALAARSFARRTQRDGMVYADELQILKLLGHPVGTTAEPERL